MEIDPKTGLPVELDAFGEIAKSDQRIQIGTAKKRFGKLITIISGFHDVELKSLAKNLKQELACGGTVKNGTIELQGEHVKGVKQALVKLGYSEDAIEAV